MALAVSSAIQTNPYGAAAAHSYYSKRLEGKLVGAVDPQKRLTPLAKTVHDEFVSHVSNADFPCVGAKAAINGNCYRFGFYAEMNAPRATEVLAHDLWNYVRELPTFHTDYATFVAAFAAPQTTDEKTFESLLWSQLQSLHELDQRHHEWDKTVSSDPEEADFSFSFAETAFFVVGLHPASSRISRRFKWATLIFNAHAQFDRLRESNQYERMQQTIRARDLKLQGSLNPNLSDFGERSEARQYSGRAVEESWKCPFHAMLRAKEKSGK